MGTPTQSSFADLEYTYKKRQTRREKFLAEMYQIIPWPLLLSNIEAHYPQSGRRFAGFGSVTGWRNTN